MAKVKSEGAESVESVEKKHTPFEPGGLYRQDIVNGGNTRVLFATMSDAAVTTVDGKVIAATGTLSRHGQTPLRVRSDSEELDAWTLVVRE